MISNQSFDFFLRNGFIQGLEPGTLMSKLLQLFGEDEWIVKEVENNGLVYGIIKMGITEFHIYNEKLTAYSYRPDIRCDLHEYKNYSQPWVMHYTSLRSVQAQLIKRKIKFDKIEIAAQDAIKEITLGGTQFGLYEDREYTFIETEGGVVLGFEPDYWKGTPLRIYRASRYYDVLNPEQDFNKHLNR